MNTQIAEFLWTATRRDILTPAQCLVLRDLFHDMFTEDRTLEDCVNFIEEHQLLDERKLDALRLQAKVGAPRISVDDETLAATSVDEFMINEAPEEDAAWEPNPGLDWFCCLAVQRGVLSKDMCLVLVADLEEASDLLGFAQSVINMGFYRDIKGVQKMIDESLERWARGEQPPFSVFTSESEARTI